MEVALHPGDINQALIELGSTVCKAREPDCETCPLRAWCQAYAVSKSDIEKVIIAGRGRIYSTELNFMQSTDIPDIEDECTLCAPLHGDGGVTSYPMKVERKKSREELDVVNVIEWRRNLETDERWFLLVRRSEGGTHPYQCHCTRFGGLIYAFYLHQTPLGLLAGLYEFPTSANVSKAISRDVMIKVPNELLSRLLLSAVPPYGNSRKKSETNALRIKEINFVGDVVHVFSHIKKTYRTQWVILEGGERPPSLRQGDMHQEGSDVEELINGGDDGLTSLLTFGAMWTKLEDVSNAKYVPCQFKGLDLMVILNAVWERGLSRCGILRGNCGRWT
jgi:A/G-specific adenine glycosylase